MTERTSVATKPVWVDLSSPDPAASREFYANLFGWEVTVSPDPQYGGYALAKSDGKDVAGIGPTMAPDSPAAWLIHLGTDDVERVARDVEAAGGRIIAPVMQVGDQGRMAVFQDPTGAFISAWEAGAMSGFAGGAPNAFGWAELSARGIDRAIPFYEQVFGWTHRTSPMGEGQPPYIEFLLDGESIAGGQEMQPMVPAEVPSYWLAYFAVQDVDGTYQRALAAGAREMLPPMDFPGGRFGIVGDPQGAAFGILRMNPRPA